MPEGLIVAAFERLVGRERERAADKLFGLVDRKNCGKLWKIVGKLRTPTDTHPAPTDIHPAPKGHHRGSS